MLKRLFLISAVLTALFFIAGNAPAQIITEREPNDTPQQANLITTGATGLYHRNDQDWFKLYLPAAGKVTATVSGLPAECQMQVTGLRGTTGLGSGIGTVTFDAPAGEVFVRLGLNTISSGVCSGSDWCAVQCRRGGPWYITPEKDGTPPKRVPGMYEGQPLRGPISYTLSVSTSGGPTQPPTYPPPTYPPPTKPPITQPPTYPPPTKPPVTLPPTTPSKPQGELIKNGGMQGSANWTIAEWYRPSNGKGEVSFDNNGVRFLSQSGNTHIGILQNVNLDVSGCSQLIFSATVRADQQRLTGTGYNGREAPIAVYVKYTDASGAVHDQLSENPNEPRNMFWNGFYFLDPVAPSIAAHGTKVVKGNWLNYSVDLMTRNPKPKYIHFLGAEGCGWPVREGRAKNLSLQCR